MSTSCGFTSLFVHLCAILPSGYGVAVWVCLAELLMGFRHKLKVCYFLNTRSNVLFLPAVNFAKIHTKCGQGKELRVWEEIKWFLLLHFTTDIPEQTLMSAVHFSPGFPLPLSLSNFPIHVGELAGITATCCEKKFFVFLVLARTLLKDFISPYTVACVPYKMKNGNYSSAPWKIQSNYLLR